MNLRAQSVLLHALLLVPAALCWAGEHNLRELHMRSLKKRAIVTDPSQLSQTYDFIIAGGGTAGLVLASRLSEDSNHTVLVLEAGDTGDSVIGSIVVPQNAFTHSLLQTSYDWGFNTVPQQSAANRALYWPRGKVLGGSSAVNGLYLVRPSQIEYDTWASLMQSQDNGNDADAWSWSGHFPYMKKTETYTPPVPDVQAVLNVEYNLNSHGSDGPLHASYPGITFPVVGDWIPTLGNLGIPENPDPHGGKAWGPFVATSAINPNNWTRSYSRDAYIDPLPPRPNLDILPNATVTKIVFNSNFTATGVQFATVKGGPVTTINVRKEVILASGSIGSPNILMHSGVGPADVLTAAGVPVLLDLPGVGMHLQDHISSSLAWETTADTVGTELNNGANNITFNPTVGQSSPFLSFINSATYYANSTTLMGSSDGASSLQQTVLNLLNQSMANFPSQDPGVLEGYKTLYLANAQNFLLSPLGQMEFLLYIIGNIGSTQQTLSIQFALQHPFSQGRLYITTNDTFDAPALDPRCLSHESDVILMRQAVKLARQIAATPPLSTVLGTEVSPGPTVTADADIDSFIANGIQTEFHPANTLAMLPQNQGGVVDARLKIYGLANVRVVDASVFPVQFAAHMQWPVYSLAEAGAEIIRTYYNGVPDPFGTNNPSSGGGNSNSGGNNNKTSTPSKGGALSASAPPVLASAIALLFAAVTILL